MSAFPRPRASSPVWGSRPATTALICLSAGLLPAAPQRVVPGGADLRAAPSDTAFVVTQMLGGEAVDVCGDTSATWVSVVPPDRVSLWMYGDLVRNGTVIAPKVEVRSGPGINYEAVGLVAKGIALTVRGNQGPWIEIAPPAGCQLWLKRSRLMDDGRVLESVPAPPASAAAGQTAVQRPPTPPPSSRARTVAEHEPTPLPAAVAPASASPLRTPIPAATKSTVAAAVAPQTVAAVVPVPGQQRPVQTHVGSDETPAADSSGSGAQPPALSSSATVALPSGAEPVGSVTVDGVVRPRGLFYRRMALPYRLVRRDGYGRSLTVCILQPTPTLDLARLEGAPVRVSGRQYLVAGWRHPLVIAERADPLPAEPAPVTGPVLR